MGRTRKHLAAIAIVVCGVMLAMHVLDMPSYFLLLSLNGREVNYSPRSQLSFSRTRIAIIGSSGYIGSRLLRYL